MRAKLLKTQCEHVKLKGLDNLGKDNVCIYSVSYRNPSKITENHVICISFVWCLICKQFS